MSGRTPAGRWPVYDPCMARPPRVVIPGVPHHVIQRGNRRQPTFFRDDDYELYKGLMAECCKSEGVAVWCYCLMPNHTHLILVPDEAGGLCRAVGEAHRRYTSRVHRREGWQGYLWQGRFASFPLDSGHLYACARYVERNPVRAQMVERAEDWPHSSAQAHVNDEDDVLVRASPLLEEYGDWRSFLAESDRPTHLQLFRQHVRTGQALGVQGSGDKIREVEAQRDECMRQMRDSPRRLPPPI